MNGECVKDNRTERVCAPMLNDTLTEALNEQMNYEFYSAHVYLAIAGYCAAESLDGFSNFFIVQAEEEKFHAMKIFKFINDRGKKVSFAGMDTPENQYRSILDAFEHAFKHEQEVTRRIYHLSDLALNDREHATMHFLKWFIDEQVEEENNFTTLTKKLMRIGSDTAALYILETELAAKVFVAPIIP
jgi:ferritin